MDNEAAVNSDAVPEKANDNHMSASEDLPKPSLPNYPMPVLVPVQSVVYEPQNSNSSAAVLSAKNNLNVGSLKSIPSSTTAPILTTTDHLPHGYSVEDLEGVFKFRLKPGRKYPEVRDSIVLNKAILLSYILKASCGPKISRNVARIFEKMKDIDNRGSKSILRDGSMAWFSVNRAKIAEKTGVLYLVFCFKRLVYRPIFIADTENDVFTLVPYVTLGFGIKGGQGAVLKSSSNELKENNSDNSSGAKEKTLETSSISSSHPRLKEHTAQNDTEGSGLEHHTNVKRSRNNKTSDFHHFNSSISSTNEENGIYGSDRKEKKRKVKERPMNSSHSKAMTSDHTVVCHWLNCNRKFVKNSDLLEHLNHHLDITLDKRTSSFSSSNLMSIDDLGREEFTERTVQLQSRFLIFYQSWNLQLLTENERLSKKVELLKASQRNWIELKRKSNIVPSLDDGGGTLDDRAS